MDLSYPESASVNDGIDPSLCSLKYISVDMVAQTIARLEKGTLLVKVDIEAAYRLVPVHPPDRQLQAVNGMAGSTLTPCSPLASDLPPRSSMPSRTPWSGYSITSAWSSVSTIWTISSSSAVLTLQNVNKPLHH